MGRSMPTFRATQQLQQRAHKAARRWAEPRDSAQHKVRALPVCACAVEAHSIAHYSMGFRELSVLRVCARVFTRAALSATMNAKHPTACMRPAAQSAY